CFLSQKGSGRRRGVKGKHVSTTDKSIEVSKHVNVNDEPVAIEVQMNTLDVGPNPTLPTREAISAGNVPDKSIEVSKHVNVNDEPVAIEVQMNTLDVGPNPSLPTREAISAGNVPGKPSYATVSGKPNGKNVNVRTLFTPGGNRNDVIVSVDSIRATSERFTNIAYGFFLRKKVAYPVVAKYEDLSTVPIWVKLHGVPVTAFSEDEMSAIATKLGAGEKKNMKKPSQTSRGVPVGRKMGFKPQKDYRPVTKNPNASSSGNKKKCVEPINEVSNSNPFDDLNSVDNDAEFGTNRGLLTWNPLVPTGIVESDSEVEVVFDETANLMISTSGKYESDKGYGTNSLLEQLRDSYPDNDDYDLYDDDINTLVGEKINNIERKICEGNLRLLDNDGNPLVPTE
nr:hypothetical protein [Tanacetum cinerariifolium]